MVQDRIQVDPDSVGLRRFQQIDEFLFCPPFGCSAAFLFELAQVVEVVDIITVARAGASFTARGDPDVVDANPFEIWKRFA